MAEKRHKKTTNDSTLTDIKRKNTKPMTEKIRRERINNSLEELKSLVLHATNKDVSQYAKMEKADILDMTVKYIKRLQAEKQNQGQRQDPNQTPTTSTLTTSRPNKFKNNYKRKPKPRCSLDLVLPPIPISAGNPNVTMETSSCVTKKTVCDGNTVSFEDVQMENQNRVAMKTNRQFAMETPSQGLFESTSYASGSPISTRSPSHVAMVTQLNSFTIEASNQVTTEKQNDVTAVIQDHVSGQSFNQVAMETTNCVATESLNGAIMDNAKCAQTYNFSSPIFSVSQSIIDHDTEENNYLGFERKRKFPQFVQEENEMKRKPFTQKVNNNTMTFTEHQPYNEKLSPMPVTPNHHTSNVRLPGMECFIRSFNSNVFPSEKENGQHDSIQYHYNNWLMGLDDQQFSMALWRPW